MNKPLHAGWYGGDTKGDDMEYIYRLIDTDTLEGLKQAEKMKRNGWDIISTGFTTIQFQKQIKKQQEAT